MLWLLIVVLLIIALAGVPVLHSLWSLLLLILVFALLISALGAGRRGL